MRIVRLIESGSIIDNKESHRLQYLVNNKRWNPYCIRHSAITADSDFLPEYALKKKVRWSMNSKQGSRLIKSRLGNDLKQKILIHSGIVPPAELERRPSVLSCPRCSLINAVENKYCSKCAYPLIPSAFEEIKLSEEMKIRDLENKYENDMKSMRQELNQKFGEMMELIRTKPWIIINKARRIYRQAIIRTFF